MLYVFLFLGLIIIILIVIMVIKFLKLREIDNVISICKKNIDELLDKKDKLIVQILDDVKDEKIKDLYVIKDNYDIFEKEDMLFDVNWNINKYFLEKKVNKKCKGLLDNINEVEESIEGLKDFYNINSISYNEVFSKVPFVYVFKLFKLDSKKSFKLRKLDSYEILKD